MTDRNLEDIGEKRQLCVVLLENSLVISQDYLEIINETLMKVPTRDLEKIQQVFDRFIFLGDGTSGATEHFLFLLFQFFVAHGASVNSVILAS